MIRLIYDSIKKVTDDIKNYVDDSTKRSFNDGAMAIIKCLRGAMSVSGLDYVPAQWLDTAAKEIKK